MAPARSVQWLLTEAAQRPELGFGIGVHGGIAEFMRNPDEKCEVHLFENALTILSGRGGIRLVIPPILRLIEYRVRTHVQFALCLPEAECGVGRLSTLTELGPDRDALMHENRGEILFDLGVGAQQVDFCIRTSDPCLLQVLRRSAGQDVLHSDHSTLAAIIAGSPHRVFRSPLGRIEVFQPIPDHGGRSPEGPHTHFTPKLLKQRRPVSGNAPIPRGWLPCAYIYDPLGGVSSDRQTHFQSSSDSSLA